MPNNLIEITPSAYDYPLLIRHLLDTPLARSPDQVIVYREHRHTYRQFRHRLGSLASALTDLGVKAGDVVAVLEWDSHRYHECYFAIPMMGAVLQTANIALPPEQLLYTLNETGASTLLLNVDFLPLIEPLASRLPNVTRFILLNDRPELPATTLPVAGEYEALIESGSPFFVFPDFDERTRATTFHTTGTTGQPKGVYFSHRQIVLHVLATLVDIGVATAQGRVHRDDVYMPMTPMFHVHSWGVPYSATLIGLKQVYAGRYAPDVFLRLIRDEGVTFTTCVPTILQMLLNAPGSEGVDLSKLKMIVGGAALPRPLVKAALERGIDVCAAYGQSEACPTLTIMHLSTAQTTGDADTEVELRIKPGYAPPLMELRVVDSDMRDVAHDGKATGEIVARAPWLATGYLNDPKASERLWAGRYLHTGDVGSIDLDGALHITDRLKDIIKSGGEWISSIDLEDIILRLEGVTRAAVIGIHDDKWGERPLVLVHLLPEFKGSIGRDEIRAHVKRSVEKGLISKFAMPDRVEFVDALPLTSVGKIDKKKLRAEYRVQLPAGHMPAAAE
ncbi:fatty-acyl-CoA synthase [Roseiarcus fermentans]|uniref:Fatty-acyl-CoA synthase n=1 Tax=Roseiarcus fermentans TaxID=1473586 RepID=A0A366F6W2_9HYPH|nr:long-chain-fatty-acid--CoA ligase [Roseiarcus fermentans]RBP10378.1 fatty-acyl-CoA synthase [Roseiarcus fermentans]